jgi:acetamidase/formamidase
MNRIAATLAVCLLAIGASVAADEPTSVVATTYYRTFSHAHPVLKRIKPGEAVATKTVDSAGLDEKDEKRSEPSNPLTGPFFVAGATVYLPVYHPGGLLFVGDGRALQADGEPTGSGIETSMDVEFVVELKKGAKLTGPRVETADEIISIGSQPEFASALDNGLKTATSDMAGWLVKDYGLETWAAHLFIGYRGRYDVVTVAGSMALCLPKNRLPTAKP